MTSLTDIANKIISRKSTETIDNHSKEWWQNEVLASKHDGYEKGYALGYAQAKADAVQVCHENAEAWGRLNADDEKHGAERCADEIAVLPIKGEKK